MSASRMRKYNRILSGNPSNRISRSVAGRTRRFRQLSVHFFMKLPRSRVTQTRTVIPSPRGAANSRGDRQVVGASAHSAPSALAIHYFDKPGPGWGLEMEKDQSRA